MKLLVETIWILNNQERSERWIQTGQQVFPNHSLELHAHLTTQKRNGENFEREASSQVHFQDIQDKLWLLQHCTIRDETEGILNVWHCTPGLMCVWGGKR
jgi:hypothetical protein